MLIYLVPHPRPLFLLPTHPTTNAIQLSEAELVRAFAIKTNDSMLSVYLAAVIRSVIALHNLIRNKIDNKRIEAAQVCSFFFFLGGGGDLTLHLLWTKQACGCAFTSIPFPFPHPGCC